MVADHDESAPEAPRKTLGARNRLRTQRHFRRVYNRGRRASGRWLTVVCTLGAPGGLVRVGLSVSKQHGGAVRRNKIKRLLREAFRHERHRLPPGLDVVLIPQQRDERYPLAELRTELVELVDRVLRAPPRNRDGGGRRRGNRR